MAEYIYSVLSNQTPILKIVSSTIKETSADTLTFTSQMTRFKLINTGTALITFAINGDPNLSYTVPMGATFDDSFLEFNNVVLSGTTGSSYSVMLG